MTDMEFQLAAERICKGDRTGLREIYDAYGGRIYSLFLASVKRHQDAEDLTSEFFLKLWNIAVTYRPGSGHKSWLYTIARNMTVDHLRRSGREIPCEDMTQMDTRLPANASEVEDTVLGGIRSAQMLSFLAEDEREIVQLHLAADLTFREIADVLKRPLGTITWKYRSAIGTLQQLAEEGRFI